MDFDSYSGVKIFIQNLMKCRFIDEITSLFKGTIVWRENGTLKQMVIMNDYNSRTGDFKVIALASSLLILILMIAKVLVHFSVCKGIA